MHQGWSSLPGIQQAVSLLDRRYARRRALELIEDRVRYLELICGGIEAAQSAGARLRQALAIVGTDHDLQRYGSPRDGGYVLARDVLVREPIVSIGVGADSSADDALALEGHFVYQFDHTVSSTPSRRAEVHFHQVGICGDARMPNTETLGELLRRAGISMTQEFSILMDAEGAEWDVLTSENLDLSMCRQVSLELHGLEFLADQTVGDMMLKGLESLSKTHCPVFLHGNNFAPAINVGGVHVPMVLEATFVRRDLLRESVAREVEVPAVPANDPYWPDLDQNSLLQMHVPQQGRHAPSLGPILGLRRNVH